MFIVSCAVALTSSSAGMGVHFGIKWFERVGRKWIARKKIQELPSDNRMIFLQCSDIARDNYWSRFFTYGNGLPETHARAVVMALVGIMQWNGF